MALHDVKFRLPYGLKVAKDVYLIVPNETFSNQWKVCDPNQANPNNWKQKVINETKLHINSQSGLKLPIPHIAYDENSGIQFIDGRHRFLVLKELGMKEIPCLVDGIDINNCPPFVHSLTKDMRYQLEGCRDEGAGSYQSTLPFPSSEFLKNWARQPDVEQWLRRVFVIKFGEEVGIWCLQFYQEHGRLPPPEQLEQQIKELEKISREIPSQQKKLVVSQRKPSPRLAEHLDRRLIEVEIKAVQKAAEEKGIVENWKTHSDVTPHLENIFISHYGEKLATSCLKYFQEYDVIPGTYITQQLSKSSTSLDSPSLSIKRSLGTGLSM